MGDLATYDMGGSGPTFVIVHGYTGSGDDFIEVARPLTDTRRVVLIDQLGHGHSPWRATYSVNDLIAALIQELDDFGEPVDLVGHSMGGRTVSPACGSFPSMTLVTAAT